VAAGELCNSPTDSSLLGIMAHYGSVGVGRNGKQAPARYGAVFASSLRHVRQARLDLLSELCWVFLSGTGTILTGRRHGLMYRTKHKQCKRRRRSAVTCTHGLLVFPQAAFACSRSSAVSFTSSVLFVWFSKREPIERPSGNKVTPRKERRFPDVIDHLVVATSPSNIFC
jgi:hypothetical protein